MEASAETERLDSAIDRIVLLVAEKQFIEAGRLLERAEAAIASARARGGRGWGASSQQESKRLDALLRPGGALQSLRERCRMFLSAQADLATDEGWTPFSAHNGTRVKYRREATVTNARGMGTLAVRIDADVQGVRPVDTTFIWREASLYTHWFPFVSSATTLHDAHPTEVALYLAIDNPISHITLALRAHACDNLHAGGNVLICVRPLDPASLPAGERLPPVTSRRGLFPSQHLLPIRLDILIEPTSATSVRFALSLVLPLHQNVPSWAVNLILAQGMGRIFANMGQAAQSMLLDSPASPHLQLLRASPAARQTYDWIAARYELYLRAGRGVVKTIARDDGEESQLLRLLCASCLRPQAAAR